MALFQGSSYWMCFWTDFSRRKLERNFPYDRVLRYKKRFVFRGNSVQGPEKKEGIHGTVKPCCRKLTVPNLKCANKNCSLDGTTQAPSPTLKKYAQTLFSLV